MRCVLLAAGIGTRLRPITNDIPKCLVPINGKPLMEYWFDLLIKNSCLEKILVNTHYLPHLVVEFVNNSKWKNFVDVVYEDNLLGTGGTLIKNRDWIGDQKFMVVHADNLSFFDTKEFIDRHNLRPEECLITMMTFDTDVPHECGILEVENSVVKFMYEKSSEFHGIRANGAVYIFEPEVLDFMENLNKSVIDISIDVLPFFMGRIFCFHNEIYHRDIGTLDSYQKAQRHSPF